MASAQAEMFWQESVPEAWAMAQTDTHLYWSTSTVARAAWAAARLRFLRRPKAGGAVTTLARNPGYCHGQLVRIGDALYAAVWKASPGAPTRILRIRLCPPLTCATLRERSASIAGCMSRFHETAAQDAPSGYTGARLSRKPTLTWTDAGGPAQRASWTRRWWWAAPRASSW